MKQLQAIYRAIINGVYYIYTWLRSITRRFAILFIPVLYINLVLILYGFANAIYQNSVGFLQKEGRPTGKRFASLFLFFIAPIQTLIFIIMGTVNSIISQAIDGIFVAIETSINGFIDTFHAIRKKVRAMVKFVERYSLIAAKIFEDEARKTFDKFQDLVKKLLKDVGINVDTLDEKKKEFDKAMTRGLEDFNEDVQNAADVGFNRFTNAMDDGLKYFGIDAAKVTGEFGKEVDEKFTAFDNLTDNFFSKNYPKAIDAASQAIDAAGKVEADKVNKLFEEGLRDFGKKIKEDFIKAVK